jgi:hypothetical protein
MLIRVMTSFLDGIVTYAVYSQLQAPMRLIHLR